MPEDIPIYRAKSFKTLNPIKQSKRGKIGVIRQWPAKKRENFEREIISRARPQKQIAEQYGISLTQLQWWRNNVLHPAMVAAQQQDDIAEQGRARSYLSWVYDEVQDSVNDLKRGKPVLDAEGQPVIDEKTGLPKMERGDPKVHGTVAALLAQGHAVAKTIGEVSGEFKTESDATPQIIRVITIPKLGETVVCMESPKELPPAVDVVAEVEPEE